MTKIELVYDKNCPNVEAARQQLQEALNIVDTSLKWTEWELSAEDVPDYIRGYGSPTILVNEKDVDGWKPSNDNNCCRIYTDSNGVPSIVPPLDVITSAIKKASQIPLAKSREFDGISSNLAILPSVGAALVPSVFCPACWPAYAGMLSSLGIGFVNYTPYLLPVTILFLIIAIAALAYRAKNRRGYKPLVLGIVASLLILFGKFLFEIDLLLYAGLVLLITVSIWNSWPREEDTLATCPVCTDKLED